MMLRPSSPLSLPNPSGKRLEREFSMMYVEPNVDAQRKMIFAKNSWCSFVSASSTRTPVARFDFSS